MTTSFAEESGAAADQPQYGMEPTRLTGWPRVQLGGVTADVLSQPEAVTVILDYASGRVPGFLGVVSVNLDHVHHFGSGRSASRRERQALLATSQARHSNWMGLVDDPQLAARAGQLTQRHCPVISWPQVATELLDAAEHQGLRVGFLSPTKSLTAAIRATLLRRWPQLVVAGVWEAAPVVLDDDERASQIASGVKRARVQLLFGCLGKPRQERWMAEHGPSSGVRACVSVGSLAGLLPPAPANPDDQAVLARIARGWRHLDSSGEALQVHLMQRPLASLTVRHDSSVVRAGSDQTSGAR